MRADATSAVWIKLTEFLKTLLLKPGVQDLFAALSPLPAWLVGGCVRDALLGADNFDVDVAVAADPQTVTHQLRQKNIKVIPTGLQFGTVTAVVEHQPFQITSLRKDRNHQGRHPKVVFSTDLKEDANRRDFTINALYLDPHGNLYDPFDGIQDLKAGKIRFIGDPKQRVLEDALRILRYYRFVAWYGKPPYPSVPVLRLLKQCLKQLSTERIQAELLKLFTAQNPIEAVFLMEQDGILETLFGPSYDVQNLERFLSLEQKFLVKADPFVRLEALFYQAPLYFYQTYWRLSRFQIRFLDTLKKVTVMKDRRWILYHYGLDIFIKGRLLIAAAKKQDETLQDDLLWARSITIPSFPLSGKDLLKQGMATGSQIGLLLAACQQWWVEHDFIPDHQECLDYCAGIKKAL